MGKFRHRKEKFRYGKGEGSDVVLFTLFRDFIRKHCMFLIEKTL